MSSKLRPKTQGRRRGPLPCSVHGCPEFQPCEQHPTTFGRATRRVQSDSLKTSQWRKIRARILARDPICRCAELRGGSACDQPSDTVHHIVDRADGGTDDDENLMGLYGPHHSSLTLRDRNRRDRG